MILPEWIWDFSREKPSSMSRSTASWKDAEGELLRLLAENVQDCAIFVSDPQGCVQTWNAGAERLLGYREQEIIGRNASVFFTPEDIQAGIPQREMAEAAHRGRGNDDRWHVRKDGRRFWSGGSLTPLFDQERNLLGFAKIMRDRSEWKQAEDERRTRAKETERRRRLYEATLSNTPDLVYVFDLDHRFTYANEGLLRMWGKCWDEAIGKNCLDLGYEPWHAAMHDREIEQVVASKQPLKGEVPFTGTFGRRVYEYIFSPVLGEDGEVEAVAGTTRDVTDRKQVEEQLRHSERFHRAIAELSTDYAFDGTIDSEGLVTVETVTDGFEKFYGMTIEEMNAKGGWAGVIHPDDHSVVAKTIAKLMAGETDRGDVRGVYRDGGVKWQTYVTVPIQDPSSGRTVGLYGAATDITARRRLTEELREQAECLSAILSASVDHIYLFDERGRYRYVSAGAARLLGLRSEEMVGRHWNELNLPSEVMERFDAQRERAIARCAPQRYDIDFAGADGEIRYYEYTIAPVTSLGSAVVVSRDETQRKRAERALIETGATLRSFYDTAPIMMGVVEVRDDDIVHITDNAATGRFFGIDADTLAGRRVSECGVPADHLREWVRRYRESQQTGVPIRFEYPHKMADGVRWVSATVFCINRLAGGGCRCSYVAEDVTERKRAEEALRDADRRKDEFLAILAHELRNPLAPILNSLQILKLPMVEAESAERCRAMIERQVQQLVRLVDDLLDVSRVMRGKIDLRRERVELAAVVTRAVETVQPLIDAQRHRLLVDLPPESLPLDADSVRLAQVFGNLLTNAAKYTNPNGCIRLSATRDGSQVVLRVVDNGIGIDRDLLPHVFELFVQADHTSSKAHGGLGIGLTLVQKLVEMHDGTVAVRSEGLGEGSEFIVRLPLMSRCSESDQEQIPTEQCPESVPRRRLLVVDDNQDAAVSLAMLLRLQGHEVRVANDGPTALEIAAAIRPDAVFLDIGMPVMDGYEVARRLRSTPGLERTVLVALTGWGQPEDRRRTAVGGFDHHLVKPPDPELLKVVLAALNPADE